VAYREYAEEQEQAAADLDGWLKRPVAEPRAAEDAGARGSTQVILY